jgi:hypothetical protein
MMQLQFKRRLVWYVVVPCFLVLIASLCFYGVVEVASAFTNIFAGERSHAKTYLFLGYMVALGLMALFWKARSSEVCSLRLRRFVAGSLVISYVLNIASYFFFITKYHFSMNDFVIVSRLGDLSSLQFLHNHVLKGVIALFAQLYQGGVYENVDAGRVFLSTVPHWLLALAALSFAASFFAVVVYFKKAFSEHLRSEDPRPVAYVFLYGLSSFILLKNILDGGAFDFAVLPAAILFGSLIVTRPMSEKVRKMASLSVLAYVIALSAYFIPHISPNDMNVISRVYQLVIVLVMLGSLYAFAFGRFSKRVNVFISLGLFAVLLWPIQNNMISLYYGMTPISVEDGAVVGVYGLISDNRYSEAGSVGRLMFYKFNPVNEGFHVGDVVRDQGLLGNFYPVSVPWSTCVPLDNSIRYSFKLKTFSPAVLRSIPLVTLDAFTFLDREDDLYVYRVSLSMNECSTRTLSVIQEFLSSQGTTDFFISEVSRGRYVYDIR